MAKDSGASKKKGRIKTGEPTKHGTGWRIRWTDEAGHRRSEVHAKPGDARLAHNRHLVEVEEWKRGLRKLQPQSVLFKDVWKTWRDLHGSRKRSALTDESFARVHLLPAFGEMAVSSITTDDVLRYKKKRAHLEGTTIHHHLTLLITLLRYAKDNGWLAELPKVPKPRLVLKEEDFSFLKSEDEIRRFLDAARQDGPFLFMLYALPIYTGLRLGEVCGLRAEDVDLGHRLITVRSSFGGPTKSAKPRMVPVIDAILPHLRAWIGTMKAGLLFPSEGDGLLRRDSPYFKRGRRLGTVLEQAGFPKSYITYHDLRHTFASHWMMRRGDIYRLQKILGHESTQTTLRYAHLAPDAYVEDYARFGPAGPASVVHGSANARILRMSASGS